MNKEKHSKLSYHDDHNVVDQRKLDMAISSAQFIKLEHLGDRFYEVETTPKKVKLDLPIQYSAANSGFIRDIQSREAKAR